MDDISVELDPDTIEEPDIQKPADKFHFVYIIFFIIGVGNLLPWNFFITANQYFMYQLRNRSLPEGEDPLSPDNRTPIQALFPNNLTLCSLFPLALASFINLMLQECIPAFRRLIFSSVLVLLMFILTVVLTKVEIVGSAFNHGSAYGIFTILPEGNARGFLEGQAMAGIVAAVANLIIIAASSDPLTVGFAYFLVAVCFIAFTIVLLFLLFKNEYFRYYWRKQDASKTKEVLTFGDRMKEIGYGFWHAMWEVRWTGIITFLTLVTTLSIFPTFFVLVVPQNYRGGNTWEAKYFHAVTVFLSFNICDYLSRILVKWVKWPRFEQRKTFLALAIVRIAIIPLSMFCNVQPRRLPVAFHHDAFPIIFVILLGLTNGYFLSLAVNYAQRYATKGNEESCGIATATYMNMGLCTGVAISYGLVMAL